MKKEALINAVQAMTKVIPLPPLPEAYSWIVVKVREFQDAGVLLFDGESGLRSRDVQRTIYDRLGVIVHAEPLWKRSLAERAIGEIKLRMAIHLDFQGNNVFCMEPYISERRPLFRITAEQVEG